MNVLLIGSGGREHALAWRLAQSEKCAALYCIPGNPGIADMAECVDIDLGDHAALVAFAADHAVDFVMIGPEAPLVAGLADALRAAGIAVFGPSRDAAILEGSKAYMKDFFARHAIPTAAYRRFNDLGQAHAYIAQHKTPVVVKTDGLAAGKGVLICATREEAMEAARSMLSGVSFGAAGREIVIEEFLEGEELSFFALTDGKTVLPFTSAQDHKRVGDGDTGLNTGGMGAYSPAHLMTPSLQDKIMERIIRPTVEGMRKDGRPYTGVLFAGIMVVAGEPYAIEYNVRFGDPECQAIMPRLGDDLLDVLYAAATGGLERYEAGLQWSAKTCLCVVMAAKGYPGAYEKGLMLSGLEDAERIESVKIFQAGTARDAHGHLISAGGRVLNVVAAGDTAGQAQKTAYTAVDVIDFPGGFCRRDIGWRAVSGGR